MRGFITAVATACLCTAACGEDAAHGAYPTDAAAVAAADAAPSVPSERLIDDGGALLLPDGAIVYLRLQARPCPPESDLTYESFGQEFFESYCLHCHSAARSGTARGGAPAGLDFDELPAIVDAAERIWGQAADANTMMPWAGTRPSMEQRRALGDWLACGAPAAAEQTDQ